MSDVDGCGWEGEIIEMEAFLEKWIRGEADLGAGLQRLADVLAEGFSIIASTGEVLRRNELLAYMENQHATDPGTVRWVENVRPGYSGGGVRVAIFDEWLVRDGKRKGNLISAVFYETSNAPNGVEWLHIHESPFEH